MYGKTDSVTPSRIRFLPLKLRAYLIIGSRSGFTMNLNPKWIRLTLDTPKVIRFAKWIWNQIHRESGSGSDNQIRPKGAILTEQTCLCFPSSTVWLCLLTQLKSLCVVSGDNNEQQWLNYRSRNWWKMHVCSLCKTTFTVFEANVRPPGECKYTEAILPWLLVFDCQHECTPEYGEFKRNMVQLTQWRQPLFKNCKS